MAKMSPTARVAAVAVNHNTAADTHILFMDIFNEVSVSSPVYLETNCGMTGRCVYKILESEYKRYIIHWNLQ